MPGYEDLLFGGVQHPFHKQANDFYVCQIANREQVAEWTQSPAAKIPDSPEANWCGLCCARMAAMANFDEAPSLPEMFAAATRYSVYREQNGRIIGAFHRQLAEYLVGSLQIPAEPRQRQRRTDLINLLLEFRYIIASVHPSIRWLHSPDPAKRCGHMIFIYGFSWCRNEAVFHYNDPTGILSEGTQVGAEINAADFEHFFSGNIITVRKV